MSAHNEDLNNKPIDWHLLTVAARRRAECLLIATFVFPGASPDFRLRIARWLATGNGEGMPS